MSRKQRQAMIDRDSSQLSLVRQCTLLDISRASLYYQPTPPRTEDLDLMGLDGPPAPEDPLLRFQTDEGLAARARASGGSKEDQADDAVNGAGSHLPAPQHQ